MGKGEYEEFKVDYVLKKIVHKGVRYYLIKWEGYSFDDCTWEPETHLDPKEMDAEYRKTRDKFAKLSFEQVCRYNFEFIRRVATTRRLWKTNSPFKEGTENIEVFNSDSESDIEGDGDSKEKAVSEDQWKKNSVYIEDKNKNNSDVNIEDKESEKENLGALKLFGTDGFDPKRIRNKKLRSISRYLSRLNNSIVGMVGSKNEIVLPYNVRVSKGARNILLPFKYIVKNVPHKSFKRHHHTNNPSNNSISTNPHTPSKPHSSKNIDCHPEPINFHSPSKSDLDSSGSIGGSFSEREEKGKTEEEIKQLEKSVLQAKKVCCSCKDFCMPGRCECIALTDGIYTSGKLLQGEFLSRSNALLVECSSACSCHPGKCWNRVCQLSDTGFDTLGRPVFFEIRASKRGGLGLWSLSNIKRGAFVIEYVGELIDESEAQFRGTFYDARKLSYLWSIYPDGDKGRLLPSLDATFQGNSARFINHSCDPNLRAILFCCSGAVDFKNAKVAFFARKNISPGTELTIDYNYEIDPDKSKEILCKCGAKNCKKRLL